MEIEAIAVIRVIVRFKPMLHLAKLRKIRDFHFLEFVSFGRNGV